MYFPIADIHCHPLVPFAAAALIAFFTSMGGVSGAVVLLPFQMSVLGYTGPGVSATNQIFNILACPAGVWRYWKEGRLLWPLAVIIAGGTLPGVFLGAFVRLRWLPDASRFKLFAAAVLLFVLSKGDALAIFAGIMVAIVAVAAGAVLFALVTDRAYIDNGVLYMSYLFKKQSIPISDIGKITLRDEVYYIYGKNGAAAGTINAKLTSVGDVILALDKSGVNFT
ncbi:MAG: sulfite exporter TauE/SafE family protein [Clostridia bacterium]|nr:sulfite exporter TauE/SafE family protein [Clostridia bacterium]